MASSAGGENRIRIVIRREDIVYLDNIMEAYDNLGLVSTVNAAAGEVIVHVTPGTRNEVLEILRNLPRPLQIMEE